MLTDSQFLYVINEQDKVVEPGWSEDMQDEVFVFSHIDGMYSYCTRTNGDPIHLGATTEVEVIHE